MFFTVFFSLSIHNKTALKLKKRSASRGFTTVRLRAGVKHRHALLAQPTTFLVSRFTLGENLI